MGQVIGRAPVLPEGLPFLNLPRNTILELWEAFNDCAEGFGLTLDEFQEIIRVTLKEYLGYSDKKMNSLAENIFHIFDDDENGLIDALEFLSSFSLISGMSVEEKVRYIFGIYDFDESGLLSVDEMTLALRSSISGLTKLSGIDPPLEAELEKLSVAAFDDVPTSGNEAGMISRDAFVSYAVKTPELSSWINYYGDLPEVEVESFGGEKFTKALVAREGKALARTVADKATMDDDSGAKDWLVTEEKGFAENFVPQEPWQNTVSFTEPSSLPKEIPNTAPSTTLNLDWIHGFNSRESRQNIFYTKAGDSIIYPAGAVGVKLSGLSRDAEKTQTFANDHTDKITALAVHHESKSMTYVATGQVGLVPKINVWTSHTMENKVVIVGFHKVGVSQLDFSPSGDLLVSVGNDQYHSIAVYDWKKKTAVFTSVSTQQPVLDARWLDEEHFSTCGQNHVYFWSRSGQVYHRQRGLFGKKISLQSMTAVASVNKNVVTGASTGHLAIWEGRNCVRAIKAHSGSITALHVPVDSSGEALGLCSASADGKVQLWSPNLEVGSMFDVSALGCIDRSVSGVAWDPPNKKILVGMFSSEIYEINDSEGFNIHDGPLVCGHYSQSVWSVATNPINPNQYVTVGSDKTVRIWDALAKKLVRMVVLDTMCRSVAYSPDGTQIAVGFGGGGSKEFKQKKDGGFVILNEDDLTIVHEARDSKQTLTCCKFSADGNSLAFGSMDRCIYVYNVGDFASKAKARGHKGAVSNIDFGRVFGTNNAVFIQSNSDVGEILFWDIETGEQQTPRNQRDTEWETQTCTLGWPTKGAWGPYDDSCKLTTCCRSSSGELLATGDSFGRIKIYRYPAVATNQNFVAFTGHAARVTNLRFSPDDKFLFSSGGDDCCVFQWVHEADGYEEEAARIEPNPEDALDLVDGKAWDKPAVWEMANDEDMSYTFAMEEQARDEDFTPVKPWQRTIVAPPEFDEEVTEPDDTLVLEHIHGYRGSDCRSNLFYGIGGYALYHIGCTVVRYNVKDNVQSFYQDARDEIVSLALHPTRPICAIGQAGKIPCIHVFDYETMTTVQIFQGHHRRAVSNVVFDPSGRHLLSVGLDVYHTMVIYDWENGSVKAKTKTVEEKTLAVDFTRDGRGIVQCGVDFIRFWDISGRVVNYKTAILAGKGKVQPFFSIGWTGNYPVIGTTDGHLYRFLGRKVDVSVKAHSSTIYSLHSTNVGLCSGSRDGTVKLWSQSLECQLSIDMQMLGSLLPPVKSVCWDNELGKVLVGTAGNEIWEVASSDGQNLHLDGPLSQGHFDNELWGMSVNPAAPHYATVGDDKTLRIWDLFEHKCIKMTALEMMSRACCYSPDGVMIAVGFGSPVKKSTKQFDGKWMIMSEDDFSIMYEARDCQKWITEMKWSPNGEKIVVGSWDNKIYLYDVDSGDRSKLKVTQTAIISQHNSFVTHMDFSSATGATSYFQSNCGAYELCFFEADTGMYIPAASRLNKTRWESQTSVLGWGVQGCWPAQNDGTEITACDVNLVNEYGNVVTAWGDNFGRLRLARYPTLSSFCGQKKFRGHCGHIVKVRWAGGDSHLLTMGSKDKGIFVWRHEADDQAVMDTRQVTTEVIDDSDVETEVPAVVGEVPMVEGLDGGTGVDKPWVASIVEPSDPPPSNADIPDKKLRLIYAHGVETQTTRNAVLYNANHEVMYPNAGLAVVYNKEDHAQNFYKGHEGNSVSALAVTQDGRFAASGDSCLRPRVRVFDACTCTEIVSLREFHRSGIVSLNFSSDNRRLVSVASDADKSICIWQSLSGTWHDGQMQCTAKGANEKVYFSMFTSPECEYQMCSGGVSHIKFWTVEGANLTSSRGLFGNVAKVQPMLCGAPLAKKFVTGTVSGHLYVWSGRKLEKIVRAHERGINAIHSCAGGLCTGGKDGFVKLWATNLEHLKRYDLNEASVPPLDVGVRSVFAGLDVTGTVITKILVGTKSSEIYEIAMKSGSMLQLHEGHYANEVWGLAMHPTDKDIYATVGDDKTLRIWSVSLNRMLRKLKTDTQMRSVAWSNDGKFLLVGCGGNSDGKRGKKDGAFLIIETLSLDVKFEGRDSRHWIRDVKYSPDGTSFAVASMDQKVYLYETKNFVLRAKAEKHNASILFFDFSTDSQMIMSDAADQEHLIHNSNDGAHFGLPSQIKNVDWFTYTCIYGWPCQGIWPTKKEIGAPVPVCANRSGDRKLLATGMTGGQVKLYNYPALKSAKGSVELGHSGEVANCRFALDDETLVTVGKNDRAIFVWRLVGGVSKDGKGAGEEKKE
ncbi:hypothetical protein TrVE_jg4710 [Triparma verrucosa]|uniref:EF-hand domain-containing protein n=1 Tax=Triparma verrucosa TaxID=1606542 RepID=A0A9W7F2R6_9STRA|nr:hypothetical protein TrVE_jg4710 [Triparma verrucosa]